MKSRLSAISNLLSEYCNCNFDYKLATTKEIDEFDSIISGINLLGQQLRTTTISRNYFSSVYNSVSSMIFILDQDGNILDYNSSVRLFSETKKSFSGSIDAVLNVSDYCFSKIRKKLNKKVPIYRFETESNFLGGKSIIASCSISTVDSQLVKGYLFILEDLTEKRESEKKLLRTIIETEENERKRLANDLHDSLGQRLSSMKMLLGVAKQNSLGKKQVEIISTSLNILESSILELRNICFNLIPAVLESGGIVVAIHQLIDTIPIEIEFNSNIYDLNLSKIQEIALYRVIQEFLNNSIKHSEATKIKIQIIQNNGKISISLKDNGVGFVLNQDLKYDHRGLDTMKSRIEAHGGQYQLNSALGKGVKINISFEYE